MKYYINAMRQYAVFNGRATRKEYWMFVLFQCLFFIAVSIIDHLLGFSIAGSGVGYLYCLFALVTFIPGYAAAVRRLHDTGRSGWFMLLYVLFIVAEVLNLLGGTGLHTVYYTLLSFASLGSLVLFVMLCLKSQPGDNIYGPSSNHHENFNNNYMNATQPEGQHFKANDGTSANEGNFGGYDSSKRKTITEGDEQVSAKENPKNQNTLAGFLISFSKTEVGEYWELREGNNPIGSSSSENTIILTENHVSGKHANINVTRDTDNNKWRVQMVDLSATNTTELNGIKQAIYTGFEIRNLDKLKVGEYYLVVFITDKFTLGLQKNDKFKSAEGDYSSKDHFSNY